MVQRTNPSQKSVPLKLALQGGGAHGAFTWGVLDRLLEVPGLVIESLSATSSGAMNAAALAQGWQRDGANGARETLEAFWVTLAQHNAVANWWANAAGWFDQARFWSPAQTAPLSFNPMRALVEEFFEIEPLRRGPVRLHLAATRVRDGALVVFDNASLSHDALLASACLPQFFPAVEINGEAYWDGGFAGNPALEPLLMEGGDDLLCVLVQPLQQNQLPETAQDIAELSAQMSFSAAFKRELRDLALTRKRLGRRLWPQPFEQRLHHLRTHMITPGERLTLRGGHSAINTGITQLMALRELGREAATSWCMAHLRELGQHASFSLSNWAGEPPTTPSV